jgi:hypothetical protein
MAKAQHISYQELIQAVAGVRSKTLGKDLTIVFGGFFFPLFKLYIISPLIVFNGF